jgi:uncharacterized protein
MPRDIIPGRSWHGPMTPRARAPDLTDAERAALASLEPRVGRLYIPQRLGLEQDHEDRMVRRGMHEWHLDTWYKSPFLIRLGLAAVGVHARGRRNARAIAVRTHEVPIARLPASFEGFTILHLSDPHFDLTADFVEVLVERIAPLHYDLCVLTGDYRARTFGSSTNALDALARLHRQLHAPAYAVLGNHDSLRTVPAMEAMGYRVLLNEGTPIHRGGGAIYLSGIDDAHDYGMQNFERATRDRPDGAVSILLSHTPEVFRQAAHAAFDLMLSGHTHGGQLCLPGGVPVLKDISAPRRFVRGSWRHRGMIGYTSAGSGASIVDVRVNCPPEVTLHRLTRGSIDPEHA